MELVRIVVKWTIFIVFLSVFGCRPLPPKALDISSPQALAEAFLESLIDEESEDVMRGLVLDKESMASLVAGVEESGEVSVNPAFVEARDKQIGELLESWKGVRARAEREGVLWKTAKYYGCRYKIFQHVSQLPLSMNFEVYLEVGGYFYRIDISTIAFEENYYIFDTITWKGEVKKPEGVVLRG